MKIAIIGSGGWGSALAALIAGSGRECSLWSWQEEESERLRADGENRAFLPGVPLPRTIFYTHRLGEAVRKADIIVSAVPSHAVRATARALCEHISPGQIILNVSKGLEKDSFLRLTQVISEELPGRPIAVMSGPSHAEEVARGIPTTNVAASDDIKIARAVQDAFMTPTFRVYTGEDMVGVELGGALKNVIALCAGIVDGLGLGDNTKAALMTRGLAEITRLGVSMGALAKTFSGLSGIGDLTVTCTSPHSRNRRAGILIGKGLTAEQAEKEVRMVVEGISTTAAVYGLAKKQGVEMPIVNEAYNVLFRGKSAAKAVESLMLRKRKHETEDSFIWAEE